MPADSCRFGRSFIEVHGGFHVCHRDPTRRESRSRLEQRLANTISQTAYEQQLCMLRDRVLLDKPVCSVHGKAHSKDIDNDTCAERLRGSVTCFSEFGPSRGAEEDQSPEKRLQGIDDPRFKAF